MMMKFANHTVHPATPGALALVNTDRRGYFFAKVEKTTGRGGWVKSLVLTDGSRLAGRDTRMVHIADRGLDDIDGLLSRLDELITSRGAAVSLLNEHLQS